MPKKKQQPEEKHPIDMTSEELLDAVVAPEVAEKLREFVRDSDDCSEQPDSEELS